MAKFKLLLFLTLLNFLFSLQNHGLIEIQMNIISPENICFWKALPDFGQLWERNLWTSLIFCGWFKVWWRKLKWTSKQTFKEILFSFSLFCGFFWNFKNPVLHWDNLPSRCQMLNISKYSQYWKMNYILFISGKSIFYY